MRIYNLISGVYWGGASDDIPDNAPIPYGWTAIIPPDHVPPGQYARLTPNLEFELTDIPPIVPVPPAPEYPRLTRRQLRLGLLHIGVTAETVETQIAAISDAQERAAAMIEWQDASTYERDHPLLVQVATALKLPASQVDDLWRWAAAL